jgi:hypothetical protein
MRLLRVLAYSLAWGTFVAAAHAAPPEALSTPALPEAARFRLDARAGWGVRDDTLSTPAARIGATGSTLSDFVLAGGWFLTGAPIGFVGRAELNRFQLQGDLDGGGAVAVSATGMEAMGAVAARLRPGEGRLLLEAQAGYGFLQVPLATLPAADGSVAAEASLLRAHGPALGVLLAFAPLDGATFEVSGRALPVTFGGRYQESAVSMRRLAAGLGVSLGRVLVGDFRLSALVGYELASTAADGTGVEVKQLRHQIAIGIRATPRPLAPVMVRNVEEPPPPVRGRIHGVVRLQSIGGAAGEPLADVAVTVPGGAATRTGPDGSFELAGLEAGLSKVNLSRADLVPTTEVVSVPPGGEVTVQIVLRRAQAPAPAVVMGIVRGEDGTPMAAQVRLLETGLTVDADRQGRFRFEVPAGRYTLTIEAAGFVTQRKSVRAGAGEQNIYNVDLQAVR